MTISDDLKSRAQEIHGRLVDELRQAARLNDERLTATGIAQAQAEMSQEARRRAQADMAPLRAQMTALKRDADNAVAPHLHPGRSTRDDWQRVQMLIESGRGIGDVIAEATADELPAIVEWAPTWIKSQTKPGVDRRIDPAMYAQAVRNDVLARWSQISDSDVFSNALAASDAAAEVERIASNVDVLVAGRTPTPMDVLAAGYTSPARVSIADLTGIAAAAA